MILKNRQRPIAFLICSGFAGIMVASYGLNACAQAPTALRVDPVLLGLPPASPTPPAEQKTTPEPQEAVPQQTSPASIPKPEASTSSAVVAPIERVDMPSETPLPPIQRADPATTTKPETDAESAVIEAAPVESRDEQSEPFAPVERRDVPSEPLTPVREEASPSRSSLPVSQQPRQAITPPVAEELREPEPSPKDAPTPPATPVQMPPATPAPTAPVIPVAAPSPQATEEKARTESLPAKMVSVPREKIVSLGALKVDPALLGGEPVRKSIPTVGAESVEAGLEIKPVPETRVAAVSAPGSQSSSPASSRQITPAPLELSVDEEAKEAQPGALALAMSDSESLPNAEDQAEPLALRFSRTMSPLPEEESVPRPVFISSKRMSGFADQEFIAEEEAELRKVGTVLTADRLTYWPVEDEVEAEGSARLEQGGDVVTGPKMRMRLEDKIGYIDQATYLIKRQSLLDKNATENDELALNALDTQMGGSGFWSSGFVVPGAPAKPVQKKTTEGYGEADRINFEGENQIRLTNATYSTCPPGNTDWFVKASDLQLDYDNEVGKGSDGTLYFLGAPILYTPWMSFSLNNERKSGFLPPKFGTSSDSGFELMLPYYWNIAPNMDATLTPHVMTKRGVMLNSEWRYLNTAFGGLYNSKVTADFLPNDSQRNNENRYGFTVQHTQATAYGLSANLDYSKVSDDNYFTDLTTGVTSTSSTQLLQRLLLNYSGGGWWSTSVNFQQYQTLQPDPQNIVREQYKMLPQITVNARKPDLYMTDASFFGQFTNFTRNDQYINMGTQRTLLTSPDAKRTVLYPQIALPYTTPGWYVTPKVGVNMRHYSISKRSDAGPDNITSTLPVFSVDSGMTFERNSNWFGKDYLQTLEPRLYYVNIPYKDQHDIPIFDSGLADFNFAQIFSENQFSGWDRVNNANQVTAAVTSRLLDPESGQEIMRGMLGQRYYFSRNRVSLDEGPTLTVEDRKWDRSDILAAFSGQVLPGVFAETALQYGISNNELKRYSVGGRYNPEPGKVLNVAYRYNQDDVTPVDQVDISGQWPLYAHWHGVGRLNYSFKDDASTAGMTSQSGRVVEAIAGLEYNGGCWVIRGVVQKLALTHDKSSTAFFIQLELNDFARIGSSPLDLLKRNIQGYRMINDPSVTTDF